MILSKFEFAFQVLHLRFSFLLSLVTQIPFIFFEISFNRDAWYDSSDYPNHWYSSDWNVNDWTTPIDNNSDHHSDHSSLHTPILDEDPIPETDIDDD